MRFARISVQKIVLCGITAWGLCTCNLKDSWQPAGGGGGGGGVDIISISIRCEHIHSLKPFKHSSDRPFILYHV